jgi:hypothetical protein
MKMITLEEPVLETVVGGDFAYDAGRVVRLLFLSAGNPGYALIDWTGTQALNDAKATK